ncbi:MAG: DUF4397 domain-containing protein, partial [Anaerolineae bacterium]|nr:DUF4397 domain-containing protein [Anaerolineae bacterium]
MKLSKRGTWRRLAWLVGVGVLMMAALPAAAQANGPQVRFVHLAVGVDPLDITLDGARAVEALAFGQ